MEGAEYNRHSRARAWQKWQKTRRDMQRRATPDAPECIDHRRRCTRHDHRTCCRGSRGSASRSASLPCHALRKRVEMCHYTRASSPRCSLYTRIAAPIPEYSVYLTFILDSSDAIRFP